MREVLGMDDYIIDFKITANRPDCNCFIGVAKEISVVLGTEFKAPVPTYKTVGGDIKDYVSIKVENYDLCPRYIGRVVKNLRIKESPDWMQKAILASELGINPQNDGRMIRLVFPQLNEERRKDLTKQVRQYAEAGKVAIRNLRRDAVDAAKKAQKKSEITEDELKKAEKDIQDLTDKYTKKIDELCTTKEKELMAV